jgi:hypothetical protein
MIKFYKQILLFSFLLISRLSFAQCSVDTVTNAFYHFLNPSGGGEYQGYLCAGTDSVGTVGHSGYYDGCGFTIKLFAGTEVIFRADSCNGNSVSLTMVDSDNVVIPGAFSASACANTIDFVAQYTGEYSVVMNLNGVCGGVGLNLLGELYAVIKPGTIIPACSAIPNDTICGAIRLFVDSVFESGNTNDANLTDPMDGYLNSIGATTCSAPNNTMWYYFRTPASMDTLNIWVTSGAGSGFHSWIVGLVANDTSDFCSGTFSFIGCSPGAEDENGIDTISFQMFGVHANEYYVLMVDGFNGLSGPFSIGLKSQPHWTGINDLTIEKFTIYPNPATDKLYIHSETVTNETMITISDLTGKVIYREKMEDLEEGTIDLHSFAAGLYIVTVQNSTSAFQKKLCISLDN